MQSCCPCFFYLFIVIAFLTICCTSHSGTCLTYAVHICCLIVCLYFFINFIEIVKYEFNPILFVSLQELLPLVFMFEIPVTTIPIQLPDLQSPTIQQLQQQFNVNVSFRQRQRGYGTTVIIRGSVYNEKLVKEATLKMIEFLLGKLVVSHFFSLSLLN